MLIIAIDIKSFFFHGCKRLLFYKSVITFDNQFLKKWRKPLRRSIRRFSLTVCIATLSLATVNSSALAGGTRQNAPGGGFTSSCPTGFSGSGVCYAAGDWVPWHNRNSPGNYCRWRHGSQAIWSFAPWQRCFYLMPPDPRYTS